MPGSESAQAIITKDGKVHEAYNRGEHSVADAMKTASKEDQDWIASMGIKTENMDGSTAIKGEPFVEFTKVEIVAPDHPNGGFVVEFDGQVDGEMKMKPYVVKEGSSVKFRAHFKVYHDTVLGLDFRCTVRYKDMKDVITEEERLGSFPPVETEHVLEFCEA